MTRFRFANYSPAADIVVAAICFVMFILVCFSNISRSRSFKLFLTMVVLLLVAAWTDMTFYTVAAMPERHVLASCIRCVYHAVLFLILVYFVAYFCEVTHFERERRYALIANVMFASVVVADIVTTMLDPSFIVDESGVRFASRGIFFVGYLGLTALCVVLMANVRKHLFRRVMFGFYGTMAISFLLLLMQGISGQSSFTVAALLLPVIAMMYVLHSNPYDAQLGANDGSAMTDYIRYNCEKKHPFVLISLYLREFDGEGKEFSNEMQAEIRTFASEMVRHGRLFRIGRGHIILIFLKKHYPDFEEKTESLLKRFEELYAKYRFDYKIVYGESSDEVSRNNEYLGYIWTIHRTMPECSIHRVTAADTEQFKRTEYILRELADICRREDLEDPRVLVYCQPVLNVQSGRYDTAEVLMRLRLEKLGIVYPDMFIHLAEEQGYIHMLTKIILHKTCGAIRRFTGAGYAVRRISVNVSVSELKDDNFCPDIIRIIQNNGIPGDRIAVELTESQNEGDFMLMKRKIGELKAQGIKIYLDDFGTGYSNMERILELPFDIIKFDRSLVLASESEDRSRRMVANLAHMFSEMNYFVLYEGVEQEAEEAMCRGMAANYLQGYKYSKPVPIDELIGYLSREGV